jgi:hypothetical protein
MLMALLPLLQEEPPMQGNHHIVGMLIKLWREGLKLYLQDLMSLHVILKLRRGM